MLAALVIARAAVSGWPVLYVDGELLWWERVLCALLVVEVVNVRTD